MGRFRHPFQMEETASLDAFIAYLREQQGFRTAGHATIHDLEPVALWLRAATRSEVHLNTYMVMFFRKGVLRGYATLPWWALRLRKLYREGMSEPDGSVTVDRLLSLLAVNGLINPPVSLGGDDNELPF